MNPQVLGGLLKRLYLTFDLSELDRRIILQKYIYLLKSAGLSVGYDFNWYLFGPYSTELTRDSFRMINNYHEIPPLKFSDPTAEERFSKLLEFLQSRKDDVEWMEIAASSLFLVDQGKKWDEIEDTILGKAREEFIPTTDKILKAATALNQSGLFGRGVPL